MDATRRDAGFLEALATMSRFWRYFLLNQCFIRLQRPGATRGDHMTVLPWLPRRDRVSALVPTAAES